MLKKIFNVVSKNKLLDIIKCNKKLQQKLNITINSYKEYSQLYTTIEIELKITNNRYGKFINIPENQNEYYHIYFDNSKEEIKKKKLKILI